VTGINAVRGILGPDRTGKGFFIMQVIPVRDDIHVGILNTLPKK